MQTAHLTEELILQKEHNIISLHTYIKHITNNNISFPINTFVIPSSSFRMNNIRVVYGEIM